MVAAQNILKKLAPDLLSLNEIQYDLPGVPDAGFATTGQNLNKLAPRIGMGQATSVFFPANTGMNAKPQADGSYILESPTDEQRRLFADPVNFGMFPGQYSTGLLSRLDVLSVKEFHNISWKQVHPDLSLADFTDSNGEPLPEDMSLFDKNFTHVVVRFQDKPLHLILFHTVPSFHFGNERTPNFQRNLDQLRFLQWYLGSDQSGITQVEGIEPLKKGASFVAMGDWNVDPESDNPGARVIIELHAEFQMWTEERVVTYHGSSFASGGFVAQFDYILLSKDLKVVKSGVYQPDAQRQELGCGKKRPKKPPEGKELAHYRNNEGQACSVAVSPEYYELKMASDHLPLFAEITR